MITHRGTLRLETERLVLRPFRYTDDDDMLTHWISDPEVQSMYLEPVYSTKQEVRELLGKYISSYENSDYYRWAIVEKGSRICIGQIALFLVDSRNRFCEIEYALGRGFHRRGYATEAVGTVLGFCFDKVGFHRVQVSHMEGSVASQGVIRKHSFVYEGTFRDFFRLDGKYRDRLCYSMLKDEYLRQAGPG